MAYMNGQGAYSVERDVLNDILNPPGNNGFCIAQSDYQLLRLATRAYDMYFTYHVDFWSYFGEWHNHYVISDEDMDIFRQYDFNSDMDYEQMMDRVVQILWARVLSPPKN